MTEAKVRVLVVDDSPTLRGALRALLGLDPAIEVVGEAGDGQAAVELARTLRPDVVTMDILMPGLDGLKATETIMAKAPTRIIIVCDTRRSTHTDLTFDAIARGALDVVAKPVSGEPDELREFGRRLAETIRLMADVPVVGRRRKMLSSRPPGPHTARVAVVGLVASTGGPPALTEILRRLRADLAFPIVIAQHVATGFTVGLARWLAESTSLAVEVAADGRACSPGVVYLPPDGHHIEIEPGPVAKLVADPDGFCPSGDRLLGSLARSFAERAVGVVLTGMGADGAEGLRAIRRAGGMTMVQEPATCVVAGMPTAAIDLGATESVLTLDDIASTVLLYGARRLY